MWHRSKRFSTRRWHRFANVTTHSQNSGQCPQLLLESEVSVQMSCSNFLWILVVHHYISIPSAAFPTFESSLTTSHDLCKQSLAPSSKNYNLELHAAPAGFWICATKDWQKEKALDWEEWMVHRNGRVDCIVRVVMHLQPPGKSFVLRNIRYWLEYWSS